MVCEYIAQHRNLPARGPRNMLGDILPARNNAGLNAGPRAFIAFTADHADMKFTLRLPILKETHEVLPTGVRMHPLRGKRSASKQASDMQQVMTAIAGYFGGYTSKMQSIGEKETRQLRQAARRRISAEGKDNNGRENNVRVYIDSPFDLMYGFQVGSSWLLSNVCCCQSAGCVISCATRSPMIRSARTLSSQRLRQRARGSISKRN